MVPPTDQSHTTETEQPLEEEPNEQREQSGMLHEMLEVMKKQQEVLQELNQEIKAQRKEMVSATRTISESLQTLIKQRSPT